MTRQRVVVVGAGVIGLTCAVRLAEAGYDAEVLTRDLPLETTSAVAGGLWLPYLAEPAAAVARWAGTTYDELAAIARESPEAGVRLRDGTIVHRARPTTRPVWEPALDGRTRLGEVVEPAPGYRHGWRLRAPLVDMGTYLTWLRTRLERAGGALTRMPLAALPQRGVVVNATGVSARALVGDTDVHPVRGQVALVEAPGVTDWVLDQDEGAGGATYVLPHEHHVVVGGTAEEGSWDPAPDPAATRDLLERATALVPALRDARVLAQRVGLRPVRSAVRLETTRPEPADPADGRPHAVVHCYGHGGSGVTLSWGCADDVLREVRALLPSG